MGPVLVPTIYRYSSTDRVSLQYFTTHTDLVKRQQQAIRQRKAVRKGLQSDKEWTGDGFVKESESMIKKFTRYFHIWRQRPSSHPGGIIIIPSLVLSSGNKP
ncbi:hypothetical protein BHM03_00003942 [Ensete ventricosum]|uniref:Uncharacterized protein n=1 Tax=Ensete ventricosum TaxID=4639 RepID=A0A445MAE8_ENSVE|nr:hypothetical protein BHM03_00003942 [Ensete ventricosum]